MRKLSGKFLVERWIRANRGKAFTVSFLADITGASKGVVRSTIRLLEANDYQFEREKLYRGTQLYRLVKVPGESHVD